MARRLTFSGSGLKTELYFCERIDSTGIGSGKQILSILKELGCEFFNFWPHVPLAKMEDAIEENGNIWTGIFHDSLASERSSYTQRPTARIYSVAECNGFFLGQMAGLSPPDGPGLQSIEEIDDLAIKQMEFALRLFLELRPLYGWTDEPGENVPGLKKIKARILRRLFWANYYGPGYVEAIDRDFLLAAPAWKIHDLKEAGIALVSNKSYCDWWVNGNNQLIEYFRSKFPEISKYKSRVTSQ